MNQTTLLFALLLSAASARSQSSDSLPIATHKLMLSVSTPQPRLKETFQISLDLNPLRSNLIHSLAGKVQLSTDDKRTEGGQLTIEVIALKKGETEIGPLLFSINDSLYTTNKIVYEVVDPIPNTDKGLWFRKVMTSDTSFCIIFEQRIPIHDEIKNQGNSISIVSKPETDKLVKFKDIYRIEGAMRTHSQSKTNFSSVEIGGATKRFMYGFGIYHFIIVDRKVKIKITKDQFDHLPKDYDFENIKIK